MTLSTLIKKGGLVKAMTATPATLATQKAKQQGTVAPVATVVVTPEPWSELSADDESRVLVWLTYIEETCLENITEVISQCCVDSNARRYFLQRAKETPHSRTQEIS